MVKTTLSERCRQSFVFSRKKKYTGPESISKMRFFALIVWEMNWMMLVSVSLHACSSAALDSVTNHGLSGCQIFNCKHTFVRRAVQWWLTEIETFSQCTVAVSSCINTNAGSGSIVYSLPLNDQLPLTYCHILLACMAIVTQTVTLHQ